MKINSARFVISNVDLKNCPKETIPEYAFIGRSNVGKSSLINMLTDRKNLAKTSGTPGKTQLLNHFIINNEWYLVDLPGIGFVKASKTDRAKWNKMINTYLLKRKNLLYTFFLIDSRHNPQKIDMEFIEWLGISRLPFKLVFTKIDKLSRQQLHKNIEDYKTYLLNYWDELPGIFLSSAKTGKGKEEILSTIQQTNKIFDPIMIG